MKNLCSLLIMLCFTSITLTAQLTIGVKTGYTNAWEDYGPDVDLPEDAEIDVDGYNASLLLHYKINKHLQIGVEPGFAQRGAACVPGWMPIFEGDTKFFFNYAETPLFVTGNLPLLNDKLNIFGRLGYGASFLVSAYREETVLGEDEPFLREKMDLGENSILNRWDHGAYGNFGIGYNLGKHQIFVEASYYHGMTDAERFNYSRNRSLSFNLGYQFSLK